MSKSNKVDATLDDSDTESDLSMTFFIKQRSQYVKNILWQVSSDMEHSHFLELLAPLNTKLMIDTILNC